MNTFYNRHSFTRFAAAMALTVGLLEPASASAYTNARADRPVVAYVDTTTPSATVTQVPWESVTHVNIAFAGINSSGECAWMDPSGNDSVDASGQMPKIIKQLLADRNARNPKAKLILSVGGWTMSYRYSLATQTQQSTTQLAASCVAMVKNLGLDGLDYDWEYPTSLGKRNCPANMECTSNNDPAQFVALLKASRTALGTDTVNHPLSVAVFVTPGVRGIPYDVSGMDPYLTFWNIMAYDMASPSWSQGTGFHSGVLDSENSLWNYAKAGATASKLNLGVPYYGYIWNNVSTPSIGTPAPGNSNNSSQYSTLALISRYQNDAGCKLYSDRNGDFYYCTSGQHQGEWAAVDTQNVLHTKAKFVRANNFGGIMMWAVQTDSANGNLTSWISNSLGSRTPLDFAGF